MSVRAKLLICLWPCLLPSLARAERPAACAVYTEARAMTWAPDSACGMLMDVQAPSDALQPGDSDSTGAADSTDAAPLPCPLSCQLLDPPPVPDAAAPDPDTPAPSPCGEDVALCIAPRLNPGAAAHRNTIDPGLFRRADEATEPPPPAPPPYSHRVGLDHVFDWVKALNTCRTITASAIARPDRPLKDEFESTESFKARQEAYSQCKDARGEEVSRLQKKLEPVVEEATFYAILPATDLGVYDADAECFFPGVTARVELDDFKSRDAVHLGQYPELSNPKRRLIPRQGALGVKLNSQTIASARLDPSADRTILMLTSYPVCVPPRVGKVYRDQRDINGVEDFGIQADITLRFRFEIGRNPANPAETVAWPIWEIDGEFSYRGDEDGAAMTPPLDLTLSVDPDQQPPGAGADHASAGSSLPLASKGPLGCQTAAGHAGRVWLLGLLMLGVRRRL